MNELQTRWAAERRERVMFCGGWVRSLQGVADLEMDRGPRYWISLRLSRETLENLSEEMAEHFGAQLVAALLAEQDRLRFEQELQQDEEP